MTLIRCALISSLLLALPLAGCSPPPSVEPEPTPAPATATAAGTITTWAGVAKACGVSVDTVRRRRRAAKDSTTTPFFVETSTAQTWFSSFSEPTTARTLADMKGARRNKS